MVKPSQYLGLVCPRHEELQGLRYRKNRVCLGCLKEIQAERQRSVEAYPALLEEVEALRQGSNRAFEHYRDKAVELALKVGEQEAELRELRGIKRRLGVLRVAALKVYHGRDREDDRKGDPRHCHLKPGHWDKDGSPCQSCAAWDRLKELCK